MILLLLACADKGDGEEDTGDLGPATLTQIQEEVFTPSCAFTVCHEAGGSETTLDLSDGHSHAALVGVESADAPPNVLVIAGDPNGSYLMWKLSAAAGITGEPMPDGAVDGLDAERLERVRSWIADGAQDN